MKYFLLVCSPALLFTVASASITGFTASTSYASVHNSGLYSANVAGTLLNFDDPYTTSTLIGGFWETRGKIRTTLPINTATHLRMDGSYFGFAGITYTGPGLGSFFGSSVQAYGELNFTVNTPSVVTLSTFGTISSVNGFGQIISSQTAGKLRFEGVDYTTNAVDANFVFNVGPGTYTARFSGETLATIFGTQNGQLFAEQSQGFRIDVVSPVPEPASLAILGFGLASVRARRKKR